MPWVPGPATYSVPARGTNSPEVPDYMVWSIISLFLCLPFGIVALVKASNANSKGAAGDIEGGRAEAAQAKMWLTIAYVIGIAVIAVYVMVGLSEAGSGY